ncbi:hypothetical protein QWY84_11635 [Aquisalimonas lutea]|uniref:hypothetical protein n=1 Tax=Aquisalimonas lutea TaxID=1327750 RepID=UPI0025B32D44|nr:hypothetical protein [Aquisalimonas lutea]MDN3518265.1 hypothetical protein [Aquisalimonas lutea]
MSETYWEDQIIGSVHTFGGVTVDEEQMRAFAREFDARPATLGEPAEWPEISTARTPAMDEDSCDQDLCGRGFSPDPADGLGPGKVGAEAPPTDDPCDTPGSSHGARPAASELHVACLCMRMMVDHVLRTSSSLGSPGIHQLRWLNTVHAGDTLTVRQCLLGKQPHPRRPDVGFTRNRTEVLNQDGRVVMYMESSGMFRRRAAAPATGEQQ